jgi:hypothetical protein
MAIIKFPNDQQVQEAEDRYCLMVGQITALWTKIHEDMAQMFANRLHANHEQAAIAWYSIRSDSGQRDLFKKLLERIPLDGGEHFPSSKDDVSWFVKKIDDLAKVRNRAIHSAVVIMWGENGPEFAPPWWSRDPKLAKLRDIDILEELATCRSDLEKLCRFNRLMNSAMFSPEKEHWPTRPTLSQL